MVASINFRQDISNGSYMFLFFIEIKDTYLISHVDCEKTSPINRKDKISE